MWKCKLQITEPLTDKHQTRVSEYPGDHMKEKNEERNRVMREQWKQQAEVSRTSLS